MLRRPVRPALLLLLALGLTAAAPATKTVRVEGSGMDGGIAMLDLKRFARAECRRIFGKERDGFTLTELSCKTNSMQRVTFICRAKAVCDGSAYQE
jgi:hypothetical protein